MDLVERVETTRFVGAEFLSWLWFCGEELDGDFELPDGSILDVAFEQHLTLLDIVKDEERVVVRSKTPTLSAESQQALRVGKLPVKAGLRFIYEQQEWIFTFDAQRFNLSSVKLPAITTEHADEAFYQRMELLEQLSDLLGAIYSQFVKVRTSPAWQADWIPALRKWVKGEASELPALPKPKRTRRT